MFDNRAYPNYSCCHRHCCDQEKQRQLNNLIVDSILRNSYNKISPFSDKFDDATASCNSIHKTLTLR